MSDALKIILSFAVAVGLTALLVPLLLPVLYRLKAGQTEREEGPEAHKVKNGTPTMGGIAFIIGIAITTLVFGAFDARILFMLLGLLLFGLVGFIDDYIKVVKKRNLGLKAWQKIVLQLAFSLILAFVAKAYGGTSVFIPFARVSVDFGIIYVPFAVFVALAMSNSVNLTDGLDGLASGITAIVAGTFTIVGYMVSDYSMSVFSAAIMGGCVGFLVYNHYPAKIFMGDTGSMALGGGLAALAIVGHFEFLLPIAGGIYVAEAMSVIIQVFVFKTQHGRRFFRMAPLHHHFELGGWTEVKVVRRFMLVTVVLCIIAIVSVII